MARLDGKRRSLPVRFVSRGFGQFFADGADCCDKQLCHSERSGVEELQSRWAAVVRSILRAFGSAPPLPMDWKFLDFAPLRSE